MSKKHKKSKIILCLSYLLITVLYIVFIYIDFAQGIYGDGIQMFGCNMYIVDSSQAVFVDYSKLPKQGDMVIYEIDGEKKIASVNSISQSNMLFLSVDENGETKYYTEPMMYGIVTSILPGVGYIYSFLVSFWGIFTIIILPCSLILLFQIVTLIKTSFKNKSKTKNKLNFEASVPMRQRRERTDDTEKMISTKTSTLNSQRAKRNVKLNSYDQFPGVAKQKKETFSNNNNLNKFSPNRPSFNNTPSNSFSQNKPSFNNTPSNNFSQNNPSFNNTSSNNFSQNNPSFNNTSSNNFSQDRPSFNNTPSNNFSQDRPSFNNMPSNNFSQDNPSFNNTSSNNFSSNNNSSNNVISNNASSNDDFYDFATTLKYKICFKDNRRMSKKLIETIENSNERLYALNEYGLATENIEDGVEIKIHPPAVSEITLKLKNDGSLIIDTNIYTANIDMEIE